MNARFEFASAGRIVFGAGTIRSLDEIARPFGTKALVVTGRDPSRAQHALTEAKIATTFFSVATEPNLDTVREGVTQARREKCEMVIALGGGSALDAGKAIAAMLTNPGDVLDYLEVIGSGQKLASPSAPFIAIPTTAGTGSEVTRNAVLASPEHRVKASLRSPLLLPPVAIVDPELTHSAPPTVTASTGLDAVTQLIEPYVCLRANPLTDALCVEGMRRAAGSLRRAFVDGRDAQARESMCVASLLGGLALSNSGLGAVHGLAGAIGGMFDAPHGAICAALLPRVMEANLKALRERSPSDPALERYEIIARILTGNQTAAAAEGIHWIFEIITDLGVVPLRDYGVKSNATEEIIAKSLRASSMKANPIPLLPDELAAVLAKAI